MARRCASYDKQYLYTRKRRAMLVRHKKCPWCAKYKERGAGYLCLGCEKKHLSRQRGRQMLRGFNVVELAF